MEPLGQPPAWIFLTYGSVCSGIEAVTVAWEQLGFRPAWFAEIDPFCSALLAHRHPGVPNLGDFTTIEESSRPIDLLAGGTPCHYAERRIMPHHRTAIVIDGVLDISNSA